MPGCSPPLLNACKTLYLAVSPSAAQDPQESQGNIRKAQLSQPLNSGPVGEEVLVL